MRKSSNRNSHFRSGTSTHAELLASFRQQMTDHARGERLKSLREARRLNQEDAAHEIGVSAKTLRTWEKGGPIKWPNAKAAGEFYEIDPEELVTREPEGDLMESLSEAQEQAELPLPVADALDALRAEMGEKMDALHGELEEMKQLLVSSSRTAKRSRS